MDPSWSRRWPAGASEPAGAWVAVKLGDTGSGFLAAALAQALHTCAAATGEPVDLTVALADRRIRITARVPRKIPSDALTVWRQQAGRLADRHEQPDPTALWAELDLPPDLVEAQS